VLRLNAGADKAPMKLISSALLTLADAIEVSLTGDFDIQNETRMTGGTSLVAD
jgi:hypothetical protein